MDPNEVIVYHQEVEEGLVIAEQDGDVYMHVDTENDANASEYSLLYQNVDLDSQLADQADNE